MSKKQKWWILGFSTILIGIGLGWLIEQRWNQWFLVIRSETSSMRDRVDKLRIGKRVFIQSVLASAPERTWEMVRTAGIMNHVSWPLLRIVPYPNQLPAIWEEGREVRVRILGFGFIPLGEHNIRIERIDPEHYEIISRESGQFVQIWNHTIRLQSYGRSLTLYTDEVEIYAGALTPIAAYFAKFFYRYRQTRWQRLAEKL